MTKNLDFIELKTSARKKRMDRVEWIDTNLKKLETEKREALKAIHRDTLSIEKLKELRERKAALVESIPQLERDIRDLTGIMASDALTTLMQNKDELLRIDDDMRAAYYAR